MVEVAPSIRMLSVLVYGLFPYHDSAMARLHARCHQLLPCASEFPLQILQSAVARVSALGLCLHFHVSATMVILVQIAQYRYRCI